MFLIASAKCIRGSFFSGHTVHAATRLRLYFTLHTYIHKIFLYSAYKFNRVTMRFGRQTVFRDCLKVSNDSPGRRSLGGRSFHRRGPATEKLLSPSLLCVRGTSRFRTQNSWFVLYSSTSTTTSTICYRFQQPEHRSVSQKQPICIVQM